MRLAPFIFIYLLISMVCAGPVAFQTCLTGLTAYGGGCLSALGTCSATAIMPPAYLACVAGAMGITGGIYIGFCIAALLAPTP
jgi:hypothetical protein